jgi:plasmid replication initiation protein
VLYNLVKLAQSQIEGVKLSDSLYKIDHAYKEFVVVELPMSDFLTDGDDKNHSRVKAALKSLHQKTFTYSDDGVWECFSIIANPRIRLRSSKVSFIVDARVWDVLLDFSRGFSRYDLRVAFTLESSYAMRMYELLAGQKDPIIYSIDALRKEFKLEGKYAPTKDFIKRVIESAKNELDSKSPITFTYTPLKEGKKFTRILFYPKRQIDKEAKDSLFKETVRKYGIGASISAEETRILTEIGFSRSGIRNNLELFLKCKKELDFIYELALLKGRAREKSNPCGWCIKALKGKLADKR